MSIKITGVTEVKQKFAAIEAFLASTKPMEGIVADIKDIILIKYSSNDVSDIFNANSMDIAMALVNRLLDFLIFKRS